MVQRSFETPALHREASSPSTADRERRGRIVARFLIAVATSATADVLWWQHQPRRLTGPIDIVGNPTFINFNYIPSFVAYRLAIYAFPVGALIVYSLLAWRGPLRRPASARRKRATARMLDLPAAEPVTVPVAGRAAVAGRTLAAAARLLLPALVVVVATSAGSTSAGSTSAHQGITARGLAYGLAYLVDVPVLAAAIAWWRASPSQLWRVQVRSAIPAVNGIAGAMASVLGLWYVSQHSVVVVLSDHSTHHWPWLPAWLAVLGMLAVAAWGVLRLRGGRAPAAVEQRLLAVVVGAAAVFLITSRMPGPMGRFEGFDDAQSLVGAHLLAGGYFPWRDFLFIHGLWMDALRSTLGFSLFGSTRWGNDAGTAVLLIPAVWVIIYLFAAWFSRRNRWVLTGIALVLLSGILNSRVGIFTFPDVRFILAPVILVLLGEMLRRRGFGWCAAFVLVLFTTVILVPEMLFLALPVLLVVVAADLTHRPAGGRIWPALRTSSWCAVVGAGLTVAWCAFLAVNHSLGAWVGYFRIFGPGHNAEGAIPPSQISLRHWAEFGLGIALVLVTFWSVVARVRGGRPWSPRDWVTVAAAGFVALYGEQALGRFDVPHIDLVFVAAIPLILLWFEQALTAADGLVRGIASRARRWNPLLGVLVTRHPATVLVMAIMVAVPLAGAPSALAAAEGVSSQEQAVSRAEPTIPRLGYADPDAVNTPLLHDLGAALDTYAGQRGPVFDMTNSLGYVYYLLDRRPASRFVHVSMAITPYSQQLLIDSLRRSRPRVVIFDGTGIGLATWDGISNNVRHYDVSQYLLSKYQPVVRTHGMLLLLRNDLMAGRPPLPRLTVLPVSTHLWFSGPACDWGSVPNFLRSPASGSSVAIPVSSQGPRVVTNVHGWVVDGRGHSRVRMLVVASGARVLGTVRPSIQLSGRAGGVGRNAPKGQFSVDVIRRPGARVTVYGLAADGVLHPLTGQRSPSPGGALTLPNGTAARIGAPIRGRAHNVIVKRETIGVAKIPAGVTTAGYDLVTLHAAGRIGPSDVTVSDLPGVIPNHDIIAHALPSLGDTLNVRVGSCLQWHGYHTRTLYVAQTSGARISRLQLSGVGG